MSDLEIFKLGISLAQALQGEEEAIADIKKLYDKHPEMFKNLQDVIKTIQEVASEPEKITEAHRSGAILAAKRLVEPDKMGEIVVENDNGTNVIFHANKKREREFDRIKNSLVETPTPSTHRDLPTGELMDKPSGANALSATSQDIIPNSKAQSQATQRKFMSEKELYATAQQKAKKMLDEMFEKYGSRTQSQEANSKDEKIKALKDEAKKISEKNKNKDLDNDDREWDR